MGGEARVHVVESSATLHQELELELPLAAVTHKHAKHGTASRLMLFSLSVTCLKHDEHVVVVLKVHSSVTAAQLVPSGDWIISRIDPTSISIISLSELTQVGSRLQ